MQTRYLHNDAVVSKAVDKRIGQALRHQFVVVVVRLTAHVEHWLFYVAHLVTQQIYRHHGNGVCALMLRQHILHIGILCTEILAEAQGLRFQPCLLQFYQYQVAVAVTLPDGGSEVNAEYRQPVATDVMVLVATCLNRHHVLFKQCRQQSPGDAFILYQVLEHDVVYRICNYHKALFLGYFLQR